MYIIVANEIDIEELTRVEIESKKQSIPECIEEYEIHYSSRRQRWQTYFIGQSPQQSKPERLVLKAVNKDKRIIGYIAGHLTTRYNLEAEIHSFYVLKGEQKRGVGTKLFAEFVKWLISINAKSLCIGFKPTNKYKTFFLKYGGRYLSDYWFFWLDTSQLLKELDSNEIVR